MIARQLFSLLFTSYLITTTAQACSADDATCSSSTPDTATLQECKDNHESCSFWAKQGECDANPNYMHIYCPISCNTCPEPHETSSQEALLLIEVSRYGKTQKVEGKDAAKTLEVIEKTVDYMKNVVFAGGVDVSEDIVGECTNKEECEFKPCDDYFMFCCSLYYSIYINSNTIFLFSMCLLGCHWRMRSKSRLHETQMRSILPNV
jgi:hypothetical protein